MKSPQIAINSVSTAAAPLPELLRAFSDAGFRNVEFRMPQVKEWMQAGNSIGDVRALLAACKLRSIGGFEREVMAFADEEKRLANEKVHIENANIVSELGGGVLVVGTDTPPEKSIAALHVIGKTLAALADRFPANVSIALEFNWSGIVKSIASASAVISAADHPRVGMLFDPAHYHCTPSKFEHLTPRVVEKILHVHVDDMADKPGDLSNCNSDRLLPGEGILDLPAIIGRIEEYGYRGFFSIEMFNEQLWALPAAEGARRCYDSMEKLCNRTK